MLFWTRLLSKIEHPHKAEIPYLAIEPQPWPVRFRDEWKWVGATANGHPIVRREGNLSTVSRVLYEALVGPVPEGMRLYRRGPKLNVNPMHYHLRAYGQKPQPAPIEQDAEAVVIDLADYLDSLNPRAIEDLIKLREDYTTSQIVAALKHANMLGRFPENLQFHLN